MNEKSEQNLLELYKKRAKHYNFTANLYYLVGYREYFYRKKAIETLNLKSGDTVVELACGTGLNFSFIQEKIGPKGKIIGVDMSQPMLDKARERIQKQGWNNVELVLSDAAKYRFPQNVNAVLSTFALALCPQYDEVVKNVYEALPENGRFAELGLKIPKWFPSMIKQITFAIIQPFGDPEIYIHRKVWESVEKYFDKTCCQDVYMGASYIVTGEKTKNE